MRDFKKLCLLTVATLALTLDDGLAATPAPKKWYPAMHLGGKYGNQRRIGQFGLFTPIAQSYTDLIYLDLRFVTDSRSAKEGNFGIGKRWFSANNQFILGLYGFYDRRHTELSNKVNQITLGFEAMSETWDYRVNAYCPENTVKEVEKNREVITETRDRYFRGHTEVHVVDKKLKVTKTREVSLKGLDLEIGRSMPGLKPLRLYGAYYHFQGRAGASSINGFRARANLELNKYVSFQFEGSHDKVRKSAGFIGVSFRVPLGKPDSKAPPLSELDKRMTEQPMRDIDIVTSTMSANHEILEQRVHSKVRDGLIFVQDNDGYLFLDAVRIHKKAKTVPAPLPTGGGSVAPTADGSYENPYDLVHQRHRDDLEHDLLHKKEVEDGVILENKAERRRSSVSGLLEELNKFKKKASIAPVSVTTGVPTPIATAEAARVAAERNEAATTLQAAFKGHQARQELAKLRAAEAARIAEEARIAAERNEGATTIQTAVRGHQARKVLSELKTAEAARIAEEARIAAERNEAATTLQSAFKGRQARQELAKLKAAEAARIAEEARIAAERNEAATTLQSAFKGRQARQELAKLRAAEAVRIAEEARIAAERNEAATTLQSAFKGRQARQELAKLKAAEAARIAEEARIAAERNEAATTLQSAFKGRQARQELAKLKAAEAARIAEVARVAAEREAKEIGYMELEDKNAETTAQQPSPLTADGTAAKERSQSPAYRSPQKTEKPFGLSQSANRTSLYVKDISKLRSAEPAFESIDDKENMGLVGQPDSLPPVTATIGHVHIPADTRGLSTLLSKNPNLDPPSTDKEQGSPLRERSINASGKSPHTTPGRASGAPLTPSKRRPAEDAAIDSSPKPSPSKVARASTKTTDVRSTTQSALPVHSPVGKRLFGSGAPTDGAAAGVDSHMLPVASPRQLSSTIRVSPAEQQVDLTEPTPQKGAEKESDTVHMLDEAVKHPTPRPSVINMELPRESVSPLRSAGDEGPSAAPAASEGIEVDQEGAHFVDEATPRQMDIADTNGRHLSEAEVLAIFDGDLSEDEEMHRQVALRSYQGNQPLMEQLYEREMEAVQRHPLLLGQGGQIAGLLEGVDTSESRVVVLPDDHEISTPGGAAVISTSSGAAVQTPQGVTLAPDRGTPVSSGGEQVYNALDALDSPEFDEVAEAVRRRAEEANRFAQQIKIQNDAALLDGDLDPEETARIEAVANRAAEEAKFAEQVNQQKVADLLDGELDVDEARKIDAVANRAAEIQQFEQQRSQPKSGLRGLWSKLFGTK